MKEPVEHILRPRLPWRSAHDPGLTECGMSAPAEKLMTRETYVKRMAEYGPQRMALLTCMTCAGAAQRWGAWSEDPRLAVMREISWETLYRAAEHGERLRDELVALAALAERHFGEFQELLGEANARRAWRERARGRS